MCFRMIIVFHYVLFLRCSMKNKWILCSYYFGPTVFCVRCMYLPSTGLPFVIVKVLIYITFFLCLEKRVECYLFFNFTISSPPFCSPITYPNTLPIVLYHIVFYMSMWHLILMVLWVIPEQQSVKRKFSNAEGSLKHITGKPVITLFLLRPTTVTDKY